MTVEWYETCDFRLTILVSDEHFAIEHFVVFEDVVKHLLVEILWRCLESDFHSPSFLLLKVDIPDFMSILTLDRANQCAYGGSLFNRMPTASNSPSKS
jgi:hypothetical protein